MQLLDLLIVIWDHCLAESFKEQYVKSLKRYMIRSSTGIIGVTSLTSMELYGFILTEDLAHNLEETWENQSYGNSRIIKMNAKGIYAGSREIGLREPDNLKNKRCFSFINQVCHITTQECGIYFHFLVVGHYLLVTFFHYTTCEWSGPLSHEDGVQILVHHTGI